MVFIIVRRNSFNEYTTADSIDDRLYMTEDEVLARYDYHLQTYKESEIAIAGV